MHTILKLLLHSVLALHNIRSDEVHLDVLQLIERVSQSYDKSTQYLKGSDWIPQLVIAVMVLQHVDVSP